MTTRRCRSIAKCPGIHLATRRCQVPTIPASTSGDQRDRLPLTYTLQAAKEPTAREPRHPS